MIIGIVAIARNYAIGKDGKLPWHYSADLKFFKETTTGHAVVMGSNTWRSIGKPLPNRLNIVLSGSSSVTPPEGVMRLSTKDEILDFAQYLHRDMFIIGGALVFKEFADVIDKWVVTHVPIDVDGADVFMPADFLDGYEIEKTIDLGDGLRTEILHRK